MTKELTQYGSLHKTEVAHKLRNIGHSLSNLRKERSLTLREFSEMTGVSISTLSKIENNQAGLAFDTVLKIVNGLDVDLEELLRIESSTPAGGRRAVNLAASAVKISTPQYDYEIFATELLNKRMVPLITTVRARSLAEWGEYSRHKGEEWMYVLNGRVEFHSNFYAPMVLNAGDSIYIDSGMGHAMISLDTDPARVLSVVYGSEGMTVAQRNRIGQAPRSGRARRRSKS